MRALMVAVVLGGGAAWSVPVQPPPPDVIPAEGATVGRNTKIWVFTGGSSAQLFVVGGDEVTTTLKSFTIPPFSRTFEKLTPDAPLTPGRYEIRAYGQKVATFTVTADEDTTPPAAPMVDVTTNGKVGNMISAINVTAASAPDSFLVVMGEPQQWEPSSMYAVGAKGTAIAYDLNAGPHVLKVITVDAAGNASEPVELTVDVPKDRACSVAPVLPLSLLALALLRRARRS